jgi:uncharacterized iron-regulated membrane protein
MNESLSDALAVRALAARRRSLYLRVHFWAALIASPFVLLATLTGLLYVLVPQVEARLYARLDHVQPAPESADAPPGASGTRSPAPRLAYSAW